MTVQCILGSFQKQFVQRIRMHGSVKYFLNYKSPLETDMFSGLLTCYYEPVKKTVTDKNRLGKQKKIDKINRLYYFEAFDACSLSPCNGHVCTNGQNGYICSCENGWSGTNCKTPPNLCISNACVNGATCISLSTNYTCECTPGYSGQFCEITPSKCTNLK